MIARSRFAAHRLVDVGRDESRRQVAIEQTSSILDNPSLCDRTRESRGGIDYRSSVPLASGIKA